MLIRLDILPDDLLDKAVAARKAWVLGTGGKQVLAAGGQKVYFCMNFMHRTCSY